MTGAFGIGLVVPKRQRTLRIIGEMDPLEIKELSRRTGLEPKEVARALLYKRIREELSQEKE